MARIDHRAAREQFEPTTRFCKSLDGRHFADPVAWIATAVAVQPQSLERQFFRAGIDRHHSPVGHGLSHRLRHRARARARHLGTIIGHAVLKGGLILGKLLPYTAIGFGQTALVLLLMVFLFGVPIHGSVALLLFLSMVFLVSALGMGIVISTFAGNQSEAMQMSLMTLLPAFLLSGFVFPRESMPLLIYLISFLIPATYYLEILRGIILRGAGIVALWDEALVLAAFGLFFMILSVVRFKKHCG